jgi:hypothetical protein
MAWLWDKIRGIGGNRSEEADEREELGGADAGRAEEAYLAETGHGQGTGIASGEAAEVARDDLDELKPPRDPAP